MAPLLRLILISALLLLAAVFSGQAYLGNMISRLCQERLESWARTEGVNLRLKSLRLYPWSAKIAVQDLELQHLGAEQGLDVTLTLPEASIGVDWGALMQRKVAFTSLSLVSPRVEVAQSDPQSVQASRQNPTSQSPQPPQGISLAQTAQTKAEKAGAPVAKMNHQPSADNLQFELPQQLDVRVGGGHAIFEGGGHRVELINITARSLPPAPTQRWQVDLSAKTKISAAAPLGEIANLTLSSSLTRPMGKSALQWRLQLIEGSQIGGSRSLAQMAPKGTAQLRKQGIDLGQLKVGGELRGPSQIEGDYEAGRLRLTQPAHLTFGSFELHCNADSTLNLLNQVAQLQWSLTATPATQSEIQEALAKNPDHLSLGRAALKALANDKGMLTLEFESTGRLSKLKTDMKLERALNNLLRGQGLGDLLQGLMKKLR